MMHTREHVEQLRALMENVLREGGFSAFAGSFIYDTPEGADFLLVYDTVPGAGNHIKKYINHQVAVIRGDLLTNQKELHENQPDTFILEAFKMEHPINEVTFRFTDKQLEALLKVATGILNQPDECPMSAIVVSMAAEVFNTGQAFLEPGTVAKIQRDGEAMRAALSAPTFGMAVLKSGLDELSKEYQEAKRVQDQQDNN